MMAERDQVLRAMAAGLFLNVASRQPAVEGRRGYYRTVISGREVAIHPSSVLHGRNPPPKHVVYTEVVATTKTFIRGVTMCDASALKELVPEFFGGGGGSSS